MKKSASIPFDFVLERLMTKKPVVKPMFGCHGVYVNDKIVLILRNKIDHPLDNGIWVATKKEHHASLKTSFPSMRSIYLLGNGETNWQNLPVDAQDFEESAFLACDLILKSDPRIGNIPKSRKKKN